MIETVIALILLICGLYFTARLGFINPVKLISALVAPFKQKKQKGGISPIKGLCTSLGGCIGTGNIIGVTACISIGGIGSIFWIWVCAFFSLATKYLEVYLSVTARDSQLSSGPMRYIVKYLGNEFKPLAVLWALLCLMSAVFSGATVQANAISEAIVTILPVGVSLTKARLICGIALAIITFIVLAGGLKACASLSTILVPIMCVIYLTLCFVCINASNKSIFDITVQIISEAFKPRSALTGSGTFLILRTLQLGISRGIFSNEAGMGTSPLALSATSSYDPHSQGGMGMWEVIIDTFVVCSATAFLVIACVPDIILYNTSLSPLEIINYAFCTKLDSRISLLIISASTILFAFTSILGWSYYGKVCFDFLFTKKRKMQVIYLLAFCVMLISGCLFPLGILWDFASTFNMVLALPNLYSLVIIIRKQHLLNHR